MEVMYRSARIDFIDQNFGMIDDYLKMVNDIENVGKYIGHDEPLTWKMEFDHIKETLENSYCAFTMIERSTDEFIGNIELRRHEEDGECELGIAITKDKQNAGYGSEAMVAILAYGFGMWNFRRIWLKVFHNNLRARHVYETCGFVPFREGRTSTYMEIVNRRR